jgi:hypothetical protein
MIDWNIQSRSHVCRGCNRHFADKETFHTVLLLGKQGYERRDICEVCWKAENGEGMADVKGFISHWQGAYFIPPPAQADPIHKGTAEGLLRKLIEMREPKHGAALFILAVMLERKRLLKVKAQTREQGVRVFVYEDSKSGDLFTIPDPELQLDQLEQVQRDVAHLLEHGLEVAGGKNSGAETASIADEAPGSVSGNATGNGTSPAD